MFIRKNIVLIVLILVGVNAALLAESLANRPQSITFLDVGQGDSILLQDQNIQIVIDGGPGQDLSQDLGELMPVLDREIELMVITHFDHDHTNGFFGVLDRYKIKTAAYHLPDKLDSEDRALIERLKEEGTAIINPVAGQKIQLGGLVVDVLHPFEGENVSGNDRSIVLKHSGVLLTGDVGLPGLNLLAKKFPNEMRSLILKVPHHGSKNNLTEAFLGFVKPEFAVISAGQTNRYGHPHQEVLDLLGGIEVLRTDHDGNVIYYPKENRIVTER